MSLEKAKAEVLLSDPKSETNAGKQKTHADVC